ncbi:MAG: hypothetical protein K9L25_13375 [Methylovulum sp.]|nr:hypothetical protein [Methylovulum sp.]
MLKTSVFDMFLIEVKRGIKMAEWIFLAVVLIFLTWVFGGFDTEEDKENKRWEKRRNCKHKYVRQSETSDHYTNYCTKCGSTYTDRW